MHVILTDVAKSRPTALSVKVSKYMAKAKKAPVETQAARLLRTAKAAGATEKGFQRAMGKATLAKQGRKATKMG